MVKQAPKKLKIQSKMQTRKTKQIKKITKSIPIKKVIKKPTKKISKQKKVKQIKEKIESQQNKSLWIGIDLEYDYLIDNAKKKNALIFPKTYYTYLNLPKINSQGIPNDEKKLIELLKQIKSPTSCYLPYLEKSKSTNTIEKQFKVINNKLHFYNDQQNCVSWLYDQKSKKVYVAIIDYDKNENPKAQILGECSKTLQEFVKRIQLESNIFFKIYFDKKKLNQEEETYLIDLLKQAKTETQKVSPSQYVKKIQQKFKK